MGIRHNIWNKVITTLLGRRTKIARVFWIFNAVAIVFFLHCIVATFLAPYGFLKEFVMSIIVVVELLLAILGYLAGFKLLKFIDNIPMYLHGIFAIIIALIYYNSLKYLWKNKEN